MVDESGAVVWAADYRPFGQTSITTNAVGNGFRFPGQYYDDETGLHYNYHRYYDPKTGRYLTPDPIGLAGMDSNLYGYVLNNPINLIDPYGLYCKIEFSEPVSGGDPIAWRYENEKIGYWNAVAQRLAWELLVAKFTGIAKKAGVPLPPMVTPSFEYILLNTTYAKYYLYVHYWEVCYDDCTGEETSRKALKPGRIDRTTEIIEDQKSERKFL